MKMLLILPLTFAWLQVGNAAEVSKSKAQFSLKTKKWEMIKPGMKVSNVTGPDPGQPPSAPARKAGARVSVKKYEYHKLPDGTYDLSTSNVCEISTQIDVYDVRGGGDGIVGSNGPTGTCRTTYQGQAATVDFFGTVLLANGQLHPSDYAPSDMKIVATLAYVSTVSGDFSEMLPQNLFVTRDLNLSSAVSLMENVGGMLCVDPPESGGGSTCAPSRDGFFSVTFEVIDTP